jgi:hypothetical protein
VLIALHLYTHGPTDSPVSSRRIRQQDKEVPDYWSGEELVIIQAGTRSKARSETGFVDTEHTP